MVESDWMELFLHVSNHEELELSSLCYYSAKIEAEMLSISCRCQPDLCTVAIAAPGERRDEDFDKPSTRVPFLLVCLCPSRGTFVFACCRSTLSPRARRTRKLGTKTCACRATVVAYAKIALVSTMRRDYAKLQLCLWQWRGLELHV